MDATGKEELGGAFRVAMRAMTSSVHIISARDSSGVAGMTATAVCSLSFEPLSILACVNRSATLFAAIERERQFAVSTLSDSDIETAKIFGSSSHRSARSQQGEWTLVAGVPVLTTAVSAIVCSVADRADFGTHRIYIGKVLDVRNNPGATGLLYGNGRFVVGTR